MGAVAGGAATGATAAVPPPSSDSVALAESTDGNRDARARGAAPELGFEGVVTRRRVDRFGQRRLSDALAIDQNFGSGGGRDLNPAQLGSRRRERLLGLRLFGGGCAGRGLPKVGREVPRGFEVVAAFDFAVREVQENRRMVLERIRLQKRRSRFFVALLIEELHALLEPAPGHVGDRVFLLRRGVPARK